MTIDQSTGLPATRPAVRAIAAQPFWRLCSAGRRRLVVAALILVALVPAVFIFSHTADARRDIVYWDEFDTALAFVLKLKEGITPGEFLQELFAINNEHRMVTSRLIFAASYWLTGTINFSVIDLVGNASIVALCILLVASVRGTRRRLTLAVLLSLLIFQLEHYENFLWSGASIDHFQVVLLAAGALLALMRNTRMATLAGGLLATLATFTLAHGLAVWPLGALVLAFSRRWRDLAIWSAMAAGAVGGFFAGFTVNSAQSFAGFTVEGVTKILAYWLAILGSVPALGNERLAPALGAGLVLLLAYAGWRGALRRERLAWPLAGFALAAAGLVAIGRAEHSAGHVFSRYYILSALAWALALFMLLNRHSHPRRPLALLAVLLPPLVAFNVFANRHFTPQADSWLNCRDIAAVNYKQYGEDGHGPFQLHPLPARATALLHDAEARGVYALGPICLPARLPSNAEESNRIAYYVEEATTGTGGAAVRGWAAIRGRTPPRSSVRLLLRSNQTTHVFTTVTVPREDVPVVMQQPGWTNAGFHFARRLAKMPAGEYQIGLLVSDGGKSYYTMTEHRLRIPSGSRLAAIGAQ